ncbi:phosphatidylglycerol lysyltransferase domain-containing protein [uncultured Roseobacter sp.]|uniref:phosphatidylglycerol lysyltransferase domain-containing protein n=1 Tax=uncultured Roseobacter sp. TaxID=114847 RepID=UPI002601DBEB|nr:phosphatidylglycerol lysyltransferase domain-containing protein [uncultured Roseobacter sp.]
MSVRVMNAPAETVLRHGMPLALVAICLYSTPQFLTTVSLPDVVALIGDLPAWVWLTAILFTVLSFFAVGQYDVLARRHLGLPGSEAQARKNGMMTVALSQVLGFGLVTGGLVRYRLRPDEGALRAGQVTGLVTIFFLIGMTFATVFAIAISGTLIDRTFGIVALIGLVACTMALTLLRPRVRLWHKEISMPGLFAAAASILWAVADVVAAAASFYILLPASVEITFLSFLPVFCIALAAGILSGAPGGVGPFELVLLGLTAPEFPAHIDQTSLLTAIFGFRAVYYLLPALIAAFFVLRAPTAAPKLEVTPRYVSKHRAPRAETNVIAQNGGQMIALASGTAALWPAGNSLVSLFDPTKPMGSAWLRDFKHHARSRNLLPVIYKCSARNAAMARKRGWRVVSVAKNAILTPKTFHVEGSKFSGLRRKLRKATNAGVTIEPLRSDHMTALAAIDAAWQARCGGARGGTMGRFCHCYLANQLVLVAEHHGTPVAFISLHQGLEEWALDLMRDDPSAPDGTMYLLVHRAIQMAAAAQVDELSLAAVPADCSNENGIWRKTLACVREKWAAKGLYQFKSAFAPRWKPLYMAAPGRFGLCIGAVDLLREVLRPAQLHSGVACNPGPALSDKKEAWAPQLPEVSIPQQAAQQ